MIVSIVKFFKRLAAAFQHVRTDGQSSRKRARRTAAQPPRRCPTCGQIVQHDPDPYAYLPEAACGHEQLPRIGDDRDVKHGERQPGGDAA